MTSLAKITVPTLPDVLTRHRLFDLLDTDLHSQALWLTGAPGDGKTTTVVNYLAHRDYNPLWYRCDEGDADPGTLLYYLAVAAKDFGTTAASSLPPFALEYRPDLPIFARQFFRRMFGSLPTPFALVFDNFQEIGLESPVHSMLQPAIDELPQGSIIIFISRSEPPSAFCRARANGTLGVIKSSVMRFDKEEATALVRSRCRTEITDAHVQHIVEQTRGWAAGIVLLCACSQPAPTVLYTRQADLQLVFDYFASEIFRKLDEDTQEVLLTTALFPMTTAAMAGRLSRRDCAGRVLEYLYQNSYFTLRDSQPDPVYQYHPLFRQFLLKQADQTYAKRYLAELKSDAVLLLTEAGQQEAAIDLCRIEQDWTTLANLLKQFGSQLVRQGRYASLTTWLSGIDESVFDANAWLQYWRGVAVLPYSPAASYPLLDNAFRSFRQSGDVTGMFRAWTSIVEAIRSDSVGDNRRLDDWIERLDELTNAYPDFPDADIECDVACGMLASLYYRAPQDPRLRYWKERAIALSMASDNLHQRASVMQWAIMHDLLRGDHAIAALYMNAFRFSVRDSVADPRIASASNFALVYYQARTGDFDAALNTMQQGLEAAHASGVAVWVYQMLAHGTTAAIGKDDLASADKLLAQMEQFAQVASGLAPLYYHMLVSWRALLGGDSGGAVVHGEAAFALARKAAFVLFDGYASYGLAQALFQRGDRERAKRLLSNALQLAKKIESRIFEHMCRMVEADFAFTEGRERDAVDALALGMALGREERYIHLTYWMPPLMSRLCAQALSRNIEPAYAMHLIRKRKLVPPNARTDDWPWPVKIITLDHFAVLIDDAPLPSARKAPKKLIALLKSIVAFGGRDVAAGRLIDALWPEHEADVGTEALDKAVQRLRRLLGDDALLVRGGRVSLNPKTVWVDTWSFERLLKDNGGGIPDALERALRMYRRNFLADEEDAPWAIATRERLRVLFVRAVSTFARRLMDAGDYLRAIECYQGALGVDSLAEELYQGALNCYIQAGRHAEGLALYRRLRQTLSVTLGIQPCAATEKFHQALLSQGGAKVRLLQR